MDSKGRCVGAHLLFGDVRQRGLNQIKLVDSQSLDSFDSSDRLFLRFWRMFRRFLVAAPLRYAGVHT